MYVTFDKSKIILINFNYMTLYLVYNNTSVITWLLINSLALSNSVVFCVANRKRLFSILLFSGQVSYLYYPYPYYNLKVGTEFFIKLIQQVSFLNFSLQLFAFKFLPGMQRRIYLYRNQQGWLFLFVFYFFNFHLQF